MLLEALKYDNRIFGLDPQLLFQVAFQMLAIFILFLLASYLLLDPVRKILNDRKELVMKEQRGEGGVGNGEFVLKMSMIRS